MRQFLQFMMFLLPIASMTQTDLNKQFALYGTVDVPVKSEMPNMSTAGGVGAQFAYKPLTYVPLFFELKGNLGLYSSKNRDVTYLFTDGTQTDTDVQFTSSMHKIQLGAKMYVTSYYKPVRAYVTPNIGHTLMNTRMRIADPQDEDDCQPLENEIRHRTRSWTYGVDLGVEFDVKRIFKNEDAPDQRLFISASYLSSMKARDYINVKYMEEDVYPVVGHDHAYHDGDGRPLNGTFVNLTSGTTHEHKIAEIYNSHLRFITINVGYVFYF